MLSKSQISFIKSLHQKKFRIQEQLFLAEGIKICTELIGSGYTIDCMYCLDEVYPLIRQLCDRAGKNIEISTVSLNELEKISLLSSAQDIVALVRSPGSDESPLLYPVLVADAIQDPGNLGTIIRIADWFGFPTLICSMDTVEWQNPKVIQASMGSFLRVKTKSHDLHAFFENNIKPVYGALLNGTSIYDVKFQAESVLVLGNESRGISPGLMPYITEAVTIPRTGAAESLNVAIAAAVICAEIRRTNF